MKKYGMIFFFFFTSLLVFAKGYTMLIPSGLPTMALSYMMEEKKEIVGKPLTYLLPKANDRMMVEMMKGTPDIAVIPSNLAAQLYQKQEEYKILGSVTSSSFYILGKTPVKNVKDLKGKKIYSFGKGLTPDLVLQTILKHNQLNNQIEIQYLSSGMETLQMYLQDKNSFVFLAEPVVSQAIVKSPETKILFSLEEEWKKQFPKTTGFPQAVVVVKKKLLGDTKLILALEQFLQESTNSLHNNDARRKEVLRKYGFDFSEELWKNILKRANIKWKSISGEKKNFKQYYQILKDENPNIIGGKLPQDSIYAK